MHEERGERRRSEKSESDAHQPQVNTFRIARLKAQSTHDKGEAKWRTRERGLSQSMGCLLSMLHLSEYPAADWLIVGASSGQAERANRVSNAGS